MTTHTPGEWEASGCTIYSGETILAVTYCEGNRELHPNIHENDTPPDSDGEEHGDGWEEAWKNARLIAAAPELLAALKKALPIVDAYRKVSLGDGDLTAANIRAAIAKAEGKA
jgi:hypothetical protein